LQQNKQTHEPVGKGNVRTLAFAIWQPSTLTFVKENDHQKYRVAPDEIIGLWRLWRELRIEHARDRAEWPLLSWLTTPRTMP
jgi:hypothetical protein